MSLAAYLRESFSQRLPPDWRCRHEVDLLDPPTAQMLGFKPRADVLIERADGTRRIWIEFEISRADPAANHMKFAAAHIHQAQPPTDSFLSMTSPHVARGRANLGASAVLVMRALGMNAFQTVLLPRIDALEIKRLNHAARSVVERAAIDVGGEVDRALSVTDAHVTAGGHRIHFVGNHLEVRLNLLRWNRELSQPGGSALWGRRTITYFVYDPHTRLFAPAKFCAFLPVSREREGFADAHALIDQVMSIERYASLDQTERRFDGAVARDHLERRLAMTLLAKSANCDIESHFAEWLAVHRDRVVPHPNGPCFLVAGS